MLFMFIYFLFFTFILIVIVIIYFVCKITINNPNTQIFHCILIIQTKKWRCAKKINFYFLGTDYFFSFMTHPFINTAEIANQDTVLEVAGLKSLFLSHSRTGRS